MNQFVFRNRWETGSTDWNEQSAWRTLWSRLRLVVHGAHRRNLLLSKAKIQNLKLFYFYRSLGASTPRVLNCVYPPYIDLKIILSYKVYYFLLQFLLLFYYNFYLTHNIPFLDLLSGSCMIVGFKILLLKK